MRKRLATWLVLALALAPAPAFGKDAAIKAFFGTYQGTGIANTKDSLYFGITMRDIDVAIHGAGDGFTVEWTTVLRQGGTPDNPRVRRKSSAITFRPTESAHRFAAASRVDPLEDDGLAWARLEGNTLTVYILTIAADGKYQLQSYARTISGSGMDLKFTRIRDGEAARIVKGKLVKVAK